MATESSTSSIRFVTDRSWERTDRQRSSHISHCSWYVISQYLPLVRAPLRYVLTFDAEFETEEYLDSAAWKAATGEKRSYELLKATDNTSPADL